MRREEEPRSLCVWHFRLALIFRGRRLSARNSGSASPVEACHPRVLILYTHLEEYTMCYTAESNYLDNVTFGGNRATPLGELET